MRDEDQMIAEARVRDERAAKALGDYTRVEEMLRTADERALLWHDSINFLERVGDSGPDDLALSARTLLARVHAL
jgi:hypothetical protein